MDSPYEDIHVDGVGQVAAHADEYEGEEEEGLPVERDETSPIGKQGEPRLVESRNHLEEGEPRRVHIVRLENFLRGWLGGDKNADRHPVHRLNGEPVDAGDGHEPVQRSQLHSRRFGGLEDSLPLSEEVYSHDQGNRGEQHCGGRSCFQQRGFRYDAG